MAQTSEKGKYEKVAFFVVRSKLPDLSTMSYFFVIRLLIQNMLPGEKYCSATLITVLGEI